MVPRRIWDVKDTKVISLLQKLLLEEKSSIINSSLQGTPFRIYLGPYLEH
jgi:hypothetical protein